MSRHSRSVLAGVAIAAMATLAACNTPATSGPAADPSVGGTSQTQAAAPKPALPTNGKCV
jgi:predicted small secreted protein